MERNAKFLLGMSVFLLGALLIGWYAYEQSREYLNGPQIVINSPKNGETLGETLVQILGNAKNVARISLNDSPIFVDSKGDFREKLLLLDGYNIITFKAQDKFGRAAEKTLELVFKDPTIETVATSTQPAG